MLPSLVAVLRRVRVGLHCSYCSVGPTAILLAIGVMNLRAMAWVTAAVTIERFVPVGTGVARMIGAILIVVGLWLIARAAAAAA
jgi:predicted metal-binding membrane protein